MAIDFEKLRSLKTTNFAKITAELEKAANPYASDVDDRFWRLERDKSGNASAVIRFLPELDGDELPWVKIYSHGFQGPAGKWYIENSLTTLGEDDPVSKLNAKLWATGNESDKELVRKQKRRTQFTSNILVISDPNHPENEGRVFLYSYGKKIFTMIMDKAKPTFVDDEAINVFNLWEGANFKLRCKTVEGYPNYDSSSFDNKSALYNGDEEKLTKVIESQHKLSDLLDKKNFKTYDQLQEKLNNVLGNDEIDFIKPTIVSSSIPPVPLSVQASAMPVTDSDDDVLAYFNNLIESD